MSKAAPMNIVNTGSHKFNIEKDINVAGSKTNIKIKLVESAFWELLKYLALRDFIWES